MKPAYSKLSIAAMATAIISSLSLKASHAFGSGNLWCRITIGKTLWCIRCVTAHTTVTSGHALPTTLCTSNQGTLCTQSTCAPGTTWRTATHLNYNGLVKKVTS
jgi:hypothetical protein